MKLVTILTSGCMAAALAACGGGAGDNSGTAPPPASPVVANFDASEFLGDWIRVDKAQCLGGPNERFAYGNYYFKSDKITLTADKLEAFESLYTDSNCTTKAGTLTEKYNVNYSTGSVTGKTNVARVQLSYVSSIISSNGGPPLTLTKLPDGSQTVGSEKGLLDVENSQLFIDDDASPKDADGYPTKLEAAALYTR